ncbi:MAG: NAD(P)/FAD-dependent oxidoreductase [Sedimentisphaerales bacterium]|nr:NAD(P)/FAD-dependent oxidoreductase [Sedimentisphaerales bacterium]
MKTKICIIGAGPAGLIAAIFSAAEGAQTVVVEANSVPGRKLLLTGGGRCNLTHQAEPRDLVRKFDEKGRFLSYCLHEFSPRDVREFFAELDVPTMVEKACPEQSRGDGCVFPATNRAGDVRDALLKRAGNLGVNFLFGRRVGNIVKENEMFAVTDEKERIFAEKLIIATGGLSWPKTGCTGDGYRFARRFGHRIVQARASLVPLVTLEKWPGQLAGTALSNVRITTRITNRKIIAEGAVIFTDNGLGGPAAQNMSRYLTDYLPGEDAPMGIIMDTSPHFEQGQLETGIIEFIGANPKRKVVNIIAEFIPKRLSVLLCEQAGCDEFMQGGCLKKEMRKKLIKLIKAVPLSIVRTGPIAEATVTRGGVDTTEINPKTMESKICRGLFFAGEVIDADGPCGGYNLQMCWSTGALAGSAAAEK